MPDVPESSEESREDAQHAQERIVSALVDQATPLMERAVDALAKAAIAQREGKLDDFRKARDKYITSLMAFSNKTNNGMVVADALGRMQTLTEAKLAGALTPRVNQAVPQDLPSYLRMPMGEAVAALASRNPVAAKGFERVSRAYASGSFALAKATDRTLTARVQKDLVKHLATGGELRDFTKTMKESGFSESYAENVYRTNMASAMTAGRVDQASDPDLRGFMVAWQWVAAMDMATRPTHAWMDGKMYGVKSPVWRIWSVPAGYQCRCSLVPITRPHAESIGRIRPDGTFIDDPYPTVLPDVGFRNGLKGGLYQGIYDDLRAA